MPSPPCRSAAALLAALAVAACGGGATSPVRSAPPPPVGIAALPHTDADVHFMSAMIGHHAQAVEMAGLAPERAATPAVRTLAARISSGQADEIATMQQWLRDRGEPVPEPDAGAHHHHHGAGAAAPMPGMLTDAQMARLREARGEEFDRLFLSSMIQHHRGAVAMVQALFDTHGAGQDDTVFRFATDVNVDQLTEIARMQRMLADLLLEGDAT